MEVQSLRNSMNDVNQKDMQVLEVHFGVPQHYLSVREFFELSLDIERVVIDINRLVFFDNTKVKVVIFAPEEGSVKNRFGLSVVFAGSLMLSDIIGDLGIGFVRGLTGHEPNYYSEIVGSESKKRAIALADMTKGFLSKNPEDLSFVKPDEIPRAYLAKNNFYKRCIANRDMAGIGFDCNDEFPIKREEFRLKIANLTKKDLGIDPEYKLHHLKIVSSVNTPSSRAQWQFQDMEETKTFGAYMKDKHFRRQFLLGKHPLKMQEEDDVIIAMVEYVKDIEEGEIKVVERNVIKVYRFNDKLFEQIPEDPLVVPILKIKSEVSSKQLNLLDSVQKKTIS